MRKFRRVFASILDSEQVSLLSDQALNLLVFLIVAQDDSGYYPWTDSKKRRLLVARPSWAVTETQVWAQELIDGGIARWEDGGIVLINGRKFNGRPRSDVPEMFYQRGSVDVTYTERIRSVSTDKIREDKTRVEEEVLPPPPKNIFTLYEQMTATPLPGNLVETLKEAERFYTIEDIEDAFLEAARHDKRNWAYAEAILKRWQREGRGPRQSAGRQQGENNIDDGRWPGRTITLEEMERQGREAVERAIAD